MSIANAAQEVLSWVSAHPVDTGLFALAGTFIVGSTIMVLKERRQDNKRLKELQSRLPEIKPIKLPPHSWEL